MPSSGYVTDAPYIQSFQPQLAPAWLDCVAILSGWAPPDRANGFSWCDLGCGHGLSAIVLAATHPKGRFVAVDLMPGHIASARRLSADARIENLEFHCNSFADAELGDEQFDYIVSHGVYTWIDEAQQTALRRLIARHLKPGGLVYLSYNTMPGWAADLPLQRLLFGLAEGLPGDSIARFRRASRLVRDIAGAGALSLTASTSAARLAKIEETSSPAYLAHEYLTPHWRPLFVTEVRAAAAAIGLAPVGSATFVDNFDSFLLRGAEREVLAQIDDDENTRELVRDFLVHRRFRRDVFGRDLHPLTRKQRARRLLATRFVLVQSADRVEFSMRTPAGRLDFDNPTTRAIVAALAAGPQRLSKIVDDNLSANHLIAGIIALCCSAAVHPVESVNAPVAVLNRVAALNRAILKRSEDCNEAAVLALGCGTAITVAPTALQALLGG